MSSIKRYLTSIFIVVICNYTSHVWSKDDFKAKSAIHEQGLTVIFDGERDFSSLYSYPANHDISFNITKEDYNGLKVLDLIKKDTSASWGGLRVKHIPVEKFRNKTIVVSFYMKVDKLEPYKNTNSSSFFSAVWFSRKDKDDKWEKRLKNKTLSKFTNPVKWQRVYHEVKVPQEASFLTIVFCFAKTQGKASIAGLKVTYSPYSSNYSHTEGFFHSIIAQRRTLSRHYKSAVKLLGKGSTNEALNIISFDDEAVYFNVTVKNKKFVQPYRNEEIWKGSSIQMAFDMLGDRRKKKYSGKDDYELGFTLVDEKPFIFPFVSPIDYPINLNIISCEIKKKKNIQEYAIKIPWTTLAPAKYKKLKWFGYNFLINYYDGKKRGFYEWTDGIGKEKDPSKFGFVFLDKNDTGIAAAVVPVSNTIFNHENYETKIIIPSFIKKNVLLKLRLNESAIWTKKYSIIKGENIISIKIPGIELKRGNNKLVIRLLCIEGGEELLVKNIKISCSFTKDIIKEVNKLTKDAAHMLTSLEEILLPYENALNRPRELMATRRIADLFINRYIIEDIKEKRYVMALREAREVTYMLQRAVTCAKNRDFFLTREKSVMGAHAKNGSFVNSSGESIYLLSHHYIGNIKHLDSKSIKDLGVNFDVVFVHTSSGLIKPKDEKSPIGIDKNIDIHLLKKNVLQARMRNNMVYAALLGMYSGFPVWFDEMFPDAKMPGNHFLKYDPDHPRVREYFTKSAEWFFSQLAKKPEELRNAFISWDMHNEPTFETISIHTLKSFRKKLSEKYENINKLNGVWGTAFKSYKDIDKIQSLFRKHPVCHYDWCVFNNNRFYNYLKNYKNIADLYIPDLPLTVKLMNNISWTPSFSRDRGYNREKLMEVTRIQGADTWVRHKPLGPYSFSWLEQSLSLDMCKSFAPKQAIIDTEYHATPYNESHMQASLWMGAWHGLNGSSLWCLTRDKDMYFYQSGSRTSGMETFFNSQDNKPLVMEAYSKAGMRIGNHMERIRKFYESDRPVCIYYSQSSINYDGTRHIIPLESVYQAFNFQDHQVGFVSEKMLKEDKFKVKGMKLLVVPNARYADANTILSLRKLEERGIKILLIGNENMTRDMYNHKNVEKLRLSNPIIWKSGSLDDYFAQAPIAMRLAGINNTYTVHDVRTGKHPLYVEARFAQYNKKTVGYAINLGRTPVKFTITTGNRETVQVRNILKHEPEKQYIINLLPMEFINFDIVSPKKN